MFRALLSCVLVAAGMIACIDELPGTPPFAACAAQSVPSAPQRVKWRFRLDGDYSLHSPGVAADGTVYVSVTSGKLYAIAPDGSARWVFQAGLGGLVFGPVSVGADGTIYVAGMVPAPSGSGTTGAIFAVDPNGSLQWVFDATNQFIIAGPNVGPDGNIYAVTDYGGIGLFSLTPAGALRFNTGSFTEVGALGEEIAFGSGQLYFALEGTLFGYTLNGTRRFQVPDAANNAQPAVGPNGNVVIESFPTNIGLSLAAYSPSGSQLWNFYRFPGNTEEHPDVGPDNVAYTVRNLSTLFAINPDGTERWRYVDLNIMFQAKVRPQNDLLFMGGRIDYGAPGFFQAVDTNGTALWRVDLPDEPGFAPYGQLVPISRPVLSPDGNTGYSVTDVAGDGASPNPYSFLYAIDLSPGAGGSTTSVTALSLSPVTVTGGCKTSTGQLTLNAAAPSGGVAVSLSTTNAAAHVPSSITVPAGSTTGSFTITTSAVASNQVGSVTATLGSSSASQALTVRRIGVQSMSLNPSVTTGGSVVNGTVTLECAAAPGAIGLTLSSSKPAVARPTVTSLNVPAGTTSQGFQVQTFAVSRATSATIKASANGTSKSKSLKVNP